MFCTRFARHCSFPDRASFERFNGGSSYSIHAILAGGDDSQPVSVIAQSFRVELATHDILLADGLPAESYLDTGNRGMFENAGLPLTLHPDMSNSQDRREAESCAPFTGDAGLVAPIWQRVAMRAIMLGHALPVASETTNDPAPRIEIGTSIFAPVAVEDGCFVFALPSWKGGIRLVSRSAVPGDAAPWVEDRRRLGVRVRQMTLSRGDDSLVISMDHPTIGTGWWAIERDGDMMWRWTDGNAWISIESDAPALLRIALNAAPAYPISAGVIPRSRLAA
jgi:hypothetical protein